MQKIETIPDGLTRSQEWSWKYNHSEKGRARNTHFNNSEKGKLRDRKYKKSHQSQINESQRLRLKEQGYINQKNWLKLNYERNLELQKNFRDSKKGQEYFKSYRKLNKIKINKGISDYAKTPKGKFNRLENRKKQFNKLLSSLKTTIDYEINYALYQWGKIIKERDGMCVVCGSKENLEAHHLLGKSLFPELMFNLNNGVTTCEDCHDENHYGKRGGLS